MAKQLERKKERKKERQEIVIFQMIVVKAPCPRLERALKEAYANESLRPTTPSAEYYQQLSSYTGKNITTITDVEFLYNTLEIEQRNNFKLPEWTNKYYNQHMREIATRSLALFTSNTLQQRLRGGTSIYIFFTNSHPQTIFFFVIIIIYIGNFLFRAIT